MALTKRAPLLLSFGSMIDLGGDSLDRRVRVHGPDDDLELRVDASLLLGVGADKRDGTDTLAIQAEVLSISNCQRKSERGRSPWQTTGRGGSGGPARQST